MLLPEFIDRWRRRLATPAERFIAIHDLAMKGTLLFSSLVSIVASYFVETRLTDEFDPTISSDGTSQGVDIIMILVLAAVFSVIVTALLQVVYKRWLYQRIIKKWPQWPADFK